MLQPATAAITCLMLRGHFLFLHFSRFYPFTGGGLICMFVHHYLSHFVCNISWEKMENSSVARLLGQLIWLHFLRPLAEVFILEFE